MIYVSESVGREIGGGEILRLVTKAMWEPRATGVHNWRSAMLGTSPSRKWPRRADHERVYNRGFRPRRGLFRGRGIGSAIIVLGIQAAEAFGTVSRVHLAKRKDARCRAR